MGCWQLIEPTASPLLSRGWGWDWEFQTSYHKVGSTGNQPPALGALKSYLMNIAKDTLQISSLRKFQGFQKLWKRPTIYEKYILVIFVTIYIYIFNESHSTLVKTFFVFFSLVLILGLCVFLFPCFCIVLVLMFLRSEITFQSVHTILII